MTNCWSCHAGVTGEECATCGALQPPDSSQNLYAYLGLTPSFEVDVAALETLYQKMQQRFHPDRYATKSETERRYSLEHATQLNEAYQILRDPLNRGVYLLQLAGMAPDRTDGNRMPSDPMFLMEVMELREGLSEIDLGAADAWDRLEAMQKKVAGLEQEEVSALSGDFSRKDYQSAADHIDRLRYHRRFLEEVDRMEERLY